MKCSNFLFYFIGGLTITMSGALGLKGVFDNNVIILGTLNRAQVIQFFLPLIYLWNTTSSRKQFYFNCSKSNYLDKI